MPNPIFYDHAIFTLCLKAVLGLCQMNWYYSIELKTLSKHKRNGTNKVYRFYTNYSLKLL